MRLLIFLRLLTRYFQGFGHSEKIVPRILDGLKTTEFYEQPTNTNTCTANVTILFYAIYFNGCVLSLTISFNSTSLRTGEETGKIELDWVLSATALISRNVGSRDDFYSFRGSDDTVPRVTNIECTGCFL